MFDEVGGGEVFNFLDHPAALPSHATTANEEHLDGGLQRVVGKRDHVGVSVFRKDDDLLLDRPSQGCRVVAQTGGALILLLSGGLAHLALEPLQVFAGVAGHEVAEVFDDRAMFFFGDPSDAGGAAFADVAEQTRAAGAFGPAVNTCRTGAGRKHP